MLVEAPVFGGQRRLDQMIGEILDLQDVVVLDPAAADIIAVAIEERDREFGFFQPVVVGGFLKRRDGERQHQHKAGGADGRALGADFDHRPPPAGDVEAVHERGIAFVLLGHPAPGLEHRAVDTRVGFEHETPEPLPPALAIGVTFCQTGTSMTTTARSRRPTGLWARRARAKI